MADKQTVESITKPTTKNQTQPVNRNTSVVGRTSNGTNGANNPYNNANGSQGPIGSGGPYDPNNPNSAGGGFGANPPGYNGGSNGYGGQGGYPGSMNCSITSNFNPYNNTRPENKVFPSELVIWLAYNFDKNHKILYSEEKGFLLPSNPTEQTKFNLGMDKPSSDYAWETGNTPYESQFFSFRTHGYVYLTYSEPQDYITLPFISFSDCTAIRAEEKRLAISLTVGSLYKDGKYIYAIKAYKDGTVKLLLGNPKLIQKDKPIDLKQVSNSITGEETIKIRELWDQVSREAAIGVRSDTDYSIITPSKECMGLMQFGINEENIGCKDYVPPPPSGYGNPFTPPLAPSPGAPNPQVPKPGKR